MPLGLTLILSLSHKFRVTAIKVYRTCIPVSIRIYGTMIKICVHLLTKDIFLLLLSISIRLLSGMQNVPPLLLFSVVSPFSPKMGHLSRKKRTTYIVQRYSCEKKEIFLCLFIQGESGSLANTCFAEITFCYHILQVTPKLCRVLSMQFKVNIGLPILKYLLGRGKEI